MGGLFNLRLTAFPAGGLKVIVLSWLVAEVLAFSLAVKVLGLAGTLLLMLFTSVLGVTLLRKLGIKATQRLRAAMAGDTGNNDVLLDGTLSALGALLLIIPGFVSDIAGLALAAPSFRQSLVSRLAPAGDASRPTRVGRKAQPDVIDLSPEDWRVVDRSTPGSSA